MRNRKVIFFLFFYFWVIPIYSQETEEFQQSIENTIQDSELDNFDFDTYNELRNELSEHPLNLNKADLEDLEISNLFTDQQIAAFLKHRSIAGKLISVYELQTIPYFPTDFIRSILPYIHINNNIEDYHLKFNKLISKGKHQFFFRFHQTFPTKDGYKNNYIGNPSKIYFRYKYNYGTKFYYGLTAEKDPGEALFKENNRYGFDFYSLHLFWRVNSKIKAVALGDFQMNWGQGLVLWTGFGFKKSTNTSFVKKEGSTLKPFTSVNEYLFLRGLGFTYQLKNLQFSPFISYKRIDANLNYSDSLENELESNRIQISGLHRTENEIEAKKALSEWKTGTNIQYKKRAFHLGFNFLYSHYDQKIAFEEKAYNKYQFQGNNLFNSSMDYHFFIKSFHFFGENALSRSKKEKGVALLNGVLFNPDKKVDMSIVHRYYAPNYQTNNYTNAFGESTNPNNEHAIYVGATIKLSKQLTFATYFDQYYFPWLKYRADKPSKGYDFIGILKWKFSKKFECYISYKLEEKEENTKIDLGSNNALLVTNKNRKYISAYFDKESFYFNDLNQEVLRANETISKQAIESATLITPILLQRLRFHFHHKIKKTWTLQTRIEFSFYDDKINKPQQGYMIYQDLKFNKIDIPFSFSTRIVLFDIPQYNSRIYAYENDVLFQFSIPAFYNTGLRFYINMNYKINNNFQIWCRFSHTYYSDIEELGTSNERIEGNKKYDIKMQLRYQF